MNLKKIRYAISLFGSLYRDFKSKITLLIILGFLNGLLGGIGIAVLIPLFSFVVKTGEVSDDPISQFTFQLFSYLGVEPRLRTLLIFVALLFVFKAIVLWIFGYIRVKVISDYTYYMRRSLYQKTLGANWLYLLKQKLGYLENIIMRDLGVAVTLLKKLIAHILSLTSIVMYLIVAFAISSFITIIALGLAAIFLIFAKPFIYKTRVYARNGELTKKDIAHRINESVVGTKTIKAAATEKAAADKISVYFNKLRKLSLKAYFSGSVTSQPIEPLAVIFISVVFSVSYSVQTNFNIAAFLVIVYLIQNIFVYLEKFQSGLHAVNSAAPHIRRVAAFQKEIVTNQESEIKAGEPFVFDKEIEFRDVDFSYQPGKHLLKGISFKIKRGKILGVIGPTGSGKTTIADLMLRLFEPSKGEILVDGNNIKKFDLGGWRRKIGYVPQDIFLKNDSIRDNIKFYNEEITEKDIIEAAKKANIYDFIQKLPDGFDTIVGERGVFLSGGQRQRIVLAREFAGRPSILILDEATSALDNQSENLIKESIEKLKGDMTVITISHRLSFIMNADYIIAIKDGEIVEQGLPKELLNRPDSYLNKNYNALEQY